MTKPTPLPKDVNPDPEEEKVWCCEYHKMAINRASRRMADRWCPERKISDAQ